MSPPVYSVYTCYTGISDFTPPDLEIVGYRVFLGNGQVSSRTGQQAAGQAQLPEQDSGALEAAPVRLWVLVALTQQMTRWLGNYEQIMQAVQCMLAILGQQMQEGRCCCLAAGTACRAPVTKGDGASMRHLGCAQDRGCWLLFVHSFPLGARRSIHPVLLG